MKDQIKLFIHIPKNGGSSVKADERTNKFVIFNTGVGWHSRWKDTPKKISDAYKAFGIIRNPWSRTVSRYMFGVESIYRGDHSAIPKNFDEFLETRYVWKNEWADPIRSWNTQYDYVCDENDIVRCDILRLEFIDDELSPYLNLNTPYIVRENVGDYTRNYQDYYNNEQTIQIVADWYEQDIDYWGFDFDTSATKNYHYYERKKI